MAAAPTRIDISTTRGLALVLPIAPAQRVLVVGEEVDRLVGALANTGAEPVHVARRADVKPGAVPVRRWKKGAPLPAEDGPFDHAIVVGQSPLPLSALTEVARGVAPGGHLLVALDVSSRRRGPQAAAEPVKSAVEAGAVTVDAVYGIRQSLTDIRHLVPLDGPALRWYARHLFLPWSHRAALQMRLFARVGPAAVLRRSFSAVAVVGRRVGEDDLC